jgi:hypothetical protein
MLVFVRWSAAIVFFRGFRGRGRGREHLFCEFAVKRRIFVARLNPERGVVIIDGGAELAVPKAGVSPAIERLESLSPVTR